MFKAVFLDYTGTMVREDDPYTRKLLKIFLTQSDLKDPTEGLRLVWELIKRSEWEHYLETFIRKDEMVDEILSYCVTNIHLRANLKEVHDLWRKSWIYAPLFDDVKPFIERCSLPVYIVTNDDLCYIQQSLSDKNLTVAGIVSAEMVRANKPHTEILEEALKIAGVDASEAVLIGDSETSDVPCAQKVGITPILLDRKKVVARSDIQIIHSLNALSF